MQCGCRLKSSHSVEQLSQPLDVTMGPPVVVSPPTWRTPQMSRRRPVADPAAVTESTAAISPLPAAVSAVTTAGSTAATRHSKTDVYRLVDTSYRHPVTSPGHVVTARLTKSWRHWRLLTDVIVHLRAADGTRVILSRFLFNKSRISSSLLVCV